MADVNVTIESMLMALIEGKKYRTLKDVLVTMNPADIALVLEEFDEESVTLIFRLLPKDQAAETFVEMESDMQEVLIKGFSDHELREVLEEIYVDDAVDLIEEMPANVVKRILAQADPQMRKEITLAHSIREAITGQRNTGDKFAGIGNIRADIQNQYAHDRMSIIIGHKLACMNIPDSDVAAADEIMHTYPAPRQMYLECLKKFGRTIGLSIYHLIQDEIKTQFISNVINLRISICSEKNN